MKKIDHLICVVIFLAVLVIHFKNGNIIPLDSRWSIYTAMSIVKEGNTDLDEYEEIIKRHRFYAAERVNGHIYSVYPVGVSFLASPMVWLIQDFSKRLLNYKLNEAMKENIPGGVETFIASFFVALTSVLIYLIMISLLQRRRYGVLAVFVFAFCTSTWSVASRALWQHAPSMLMLTLTLYLLLLARNKERFVQWAGMPLAFSCVVRPTNILPALLFAVYVLIKYRSQFVRFVLYALLVAIPYLVFNYAVYDSLMLPFYQYLIKTTGPNSRFFEALAGNLISPSRGLLIFIPVFLFSIYGIILKLKSGKMEAIDYVLVLIIFLHWISISLHVFWWAGHTFGPRYFSDMIPFLIYFLVPVFEKMMNLKSLKKVILCVFFYLSVVCSFWIHYRGANDWATHVWNVEPVNVDEAPQRVWDWSDIQFLR